MHEHVQMTRAPNELIKELSGKTIERLISLSVTYSRSHDGIIQQFSYKLRCKRDPAMRQWVIVLRFLTKSLLLLSATHIVLVALSLARLRCIAASLIENPMARFGCPIRIQFAKVSL